MRECQASHASVPSVALLSTSTVVKHTDYMRTLICSHLQTQAYTSPLYSVRNTVTSLQH